MSGPGIVLCWRGAPSASMQAISRRKRNVSEPEASTSSAKRPRSKKGAAETQAEESQAAETQAPETQAESDDDSCGYPCASESATEGSQDWRIQRSSDL